MANILYPPPRPQSVGEILDSAFRIFRATLLQCLPYATVAVIASQLPNIYYLASGRGALACGWTVLLVTGKGAVASMVQSWRLTSGSWWRLTLIYSVALVLLIVLYVLSGLIAGLLAMLLAHGDIAVITAATTVLVVVLSAIGTPFYWALALAVLGDLSARREGADLAQRLAAPAR